MRRVLAFCGLGILLSGCGGSGTGGSPVSGSVTVDGQPLAWGQVYLHSAELDKASNTQQVMIEVRDGKFATLPGTGLVPGEYAATLFVYEGSAPPPPDPSIAEASPPLPVTVGQWDGTRQVQSDTPLTIELKQSDLVATAGGEKRR